MLRKTRLFSPAAASAALTLTLLVFGGTAVAIEGGDPLAKRLAMVHTLLFDSSAAKQIEKKTTTFKTEKHLLLIAILR